MGREWLEDGDDSGGREGGEERLTLKLSSELTISRSSYWEEGMAERNGEDAQTGMG